MNKSSAPILVGTLAGLLAVSLACSGDGPTAVVAGPPASLLITGGQDQSTAVGKELLNVLEVKIVDAKQRPVKGQVVNFRVVSGGGSVFAGVAITSDSGIAKERWTLGTVAADSQRVEARAVDDKGTALVFGVFRSVALPDVPATVRKIAGDSQVVAAGASASDSLSVAVVDRYGNPVPRSTVRWTVTSGGGRVSADSSVANDAGQAKVRWTVGQRVDSTQRVTAQHGTLTPVTFSATVKAADATALQLSQQAAGAASGGAFVTAPKVRIRDAYGNQVTTSTAAVTLTVSAGASVVGTATTNAVNGEATFSTAGLAGTVGDYTLTYSAAGLLSATQTIALTAGVPSQLAITTQPAGAVSGAIFVTQPVVELRDAQGNRTTSTAMVTASVASGGGALVGTSVVASANGVAAFTNLRIDLAAAHTLAFTVATPSLTATSGAFSITPGAPSKLAITREGLVGPSGGTFATQPVVEVRDTWGNRVSGSTIPVTMSVSAGGMLSGTTTVNSIAGVATFVNTGVSGSAEAHSIIFASPDVGSASQHAILPATASFSLNEGYTCGLTSVGVAYCWGSNLFGQLGDGTTISTSTPKAVSTPLRFSTITIGVGHACGLTGAGAAHCWGYNGDGRIGDGTTTDRGTPVAVGGGLTFAMVTIGSGHTCGLTSTGVAYCWGSNLFGQLGDGTTTKRITPTAVSTELRFTVLAAGRAHTCGLTSAGSAYCWGDNDPGWPGDGTNQRMIPTAVSSGLKFKSISAGYAHTCGLTSEGVAYCWGTNRRGEIGDGTTNARAAPAEVTGGLRFTAISSGTEYTCGVTVTGAAFCWGLNFGQLGDGTNTSRLSPTAVSGSIKFAKVIASVQHTCGLMGNGSAFCWGYNAKGQLGDGTNESRMIPTAVGGGLSFRVP